MSLLEQGEARGRPQREDDDTDEREMKALHACPLPPTGVRESKTLLFHA